VPVAVAGAMLLPRCSRRGGRRWGGVRQAHSKSKRGKTQRSGDRRFGQNLLQVHRAPLACNPFGDATRRRSAGTSGLSPNGGESMVPMAQRDHRS